MSKAPIESHRVGTTALPTVPGIRLRHYRGPEDIPEMVSVINRSRESDGVDFVITRSDLDIQFNNPLDFDPFEDILVAETDGRIIGLARVWCKDRKGGRRAYGHSVELLRERRGKGIREELFRYNEEHIRRLAHREGRVGKSDFELWANDSNNEWKSIVVKSGYHPVQHELDLVRSLDKIPEIPVPDGFEVRPVKPEHYESIRKANLDAWKDDWNFSVEDWDKEHFEAYKKRSMFQPELWQVAWKGDILAGMVLNYIIEEENQQLGKRRGHTENVYVRSEFRRVGLAKALLARSFKILKEKGMDEAMLSAEIENPHDALKLYKGLGFVVVKHFTWYLKPIV